MNNSLHARQLIIMLRREIWEHSMLFWGAPITLLGLLILFAAWIFAQFGVSQIDNLAGNFDGILIDISTTGLGYYLMLVAAPFLVVLYASSITYMLIALYSDRKDLSILFWYSMPVSNTLQVISKVITVLVIMPLFYIAVIGVGYLLLWIAVVAMSIGTDTAPVGLLDLLISSLYALIFLLLSLVVSGLLWLPTVGWFLLISAFARSLPLLWVMGIFIALGFLEDLIFSTQYLAVWVDGHSNLSDYFVLEFNDFFIKLFTYEMFYGMLIGLVLLIGAVNMRRFADQ